MATINLAVGAAGDDGWASQNTTGTGIFPNQTVNNIAGNHSGQSGAIGSWHRFTHADILNLRGGVTINSATLKILSRGTDGSPVTRIYCDDAANPAAPTTATDFRTKPLTTAFFNVPSWPAAASRTSFNITTLIQELVDSYPSTIAAIQILHRDNGTATGFIFYKEAPYDDAAGDAAQLDIDYTPATTTVTPTTASLTLTTFAPTVGILSFEEALSDESDATYVELVSADSPSTFEVTLEEASQPGPGDGTLTIRAERLAE